MQRDVYQLLIPVLKTQMQKAVKLHYRHLHLLHLLIMKIHGIPKIQTRIRILKQEIQTQEMMMAMEETMAAIAVVEEMQQNKSNVATAHNYSECDSVVQPGISS